MPPYVADTTGFKHPYAVEASSVNTTPVSKSSVRVYEETGANGVTLPAVHFTSAEGDTKLGAELPSRSRTDSARMSTTQPGENASRLDRIVSTRVALLARLNAERALTVEEEARLAIADAEL